MSSLLQLVTRDRLDCIQRAALTCALNNAKAGDSAEKVLGTAVIYAVGALEAIEERRSARMAEILMTD